MPYYLNNGVEKIHFSFDVDFVKQYCALMQLEYSETDVPPLCCAKLWPQFQMFQSFVGQSITLRSTELQQCEPLHINKDYLATLQCIEVRRIRSFRKYTFQLHITDERNEVLTITQTFVESVGE